VLNHKKKSGEKEVSKNQIDLLAVKNITKIKLSGLLNSRA
jgi:hypothetical protein